MLLSGELDVTAYREQVGLDGKETWLEKITAEMTAVTALQVGASKKDIKRSKRIGKCGIWINLMPNKLNGNILLREEWPNNIRF